MLEQWIPKEKKNNRRGEVPLEMTELYMPTELEFSTWIPSVLGLSAGEVMVTESTTTCLQLSKRKWNCGLFRTSSASTVRFELSKNRSACAPSRVEWYQWGFLSKIPPQSLLRWVKEREENSALTTGLSQGPGSVDPLAPCKNR